MHTRRHALPVACPAGLLLASMKLRGNLISGGREGRGTESRCHEEADSFLVKSCKARSAQVNCLKLPHSGSSEERTTLTRRQERQIQGSSFRKGEIPLDEAGAFELEACVQSHVSALQGKEHHQEEAAFRARSRRPLTSYVADERDASAGSFSLCPKWCRWGEGSASFSFSFSFFFSCFFIDSAINCSKAMKSPSSSGSRSAF